MNSEPHTVGEATITYFLTLKAQLQLTSCLEVYDMLSVSQLEVKDLIQTLACLELVVLELAAYLD